MKQPKGAPMTLHEWGRWAAMQPKYTQMELLDLVWKGWCQDPLCPNNINYGLKPGTLLRIKLPERKE